jgi:SLOG cluster3 family
MRKEMILSRDFAGAVFIGGMEGTLEEFDIFVKHHPRATVLPVASTGAAADIIFKRGSFDAQLKRNLTFPSLFRHRLPLGRPRI